MCLAYNSMTDNQIVTDYKRCFTEASILINENILQIHYEMSAPE